MRYKTLLMVMTTVLASCGQDELTDTASRPGESKLSDRAVELSLSASLLEPEAQTRAPLEQSSGYFTQGQQVGVFISENSELTSAEGRTTYNGDGLIATTASNSTGALSFGSTTHYYWPSSGYGLTVAGWHPMFADDEAGALYPGLAVNATPTFTVQANQGSDLKSSDLMFATATKDRTKGVATDGMTLNFAHQLMQVKVNLQAEDGLGITASTLMHSAIRIGTASSSIKGSVRIDNLLTGAVTMLDTPLGAPLVLTTDYAGTVTAGTQNTVTTNAYAVIPPQDLQGLLMTITLSDAQGGGNLMVELPGNTYAPNSTLTYNITMRLTGVVVTHTIKPWGADEDDTQATNAVYVND